MAMARYTTIGVYILANYLINNSAGAFLAVASCTISRILDNLLSVNAVVTSTREVELRLIIPARITSPFDLESGLLSPVNAAVLKVASSESIFPSYASFSPGLNSMIAPIGTSGALVSVTSRPSTTFATSGL